MEMFTYKTGGDGYTWEYRWKNDLKGSPYSLHENIFKDTMKIPEGTKQTTNNLKTEKWLHPGRVKSQLSLWGKLEGQPLQVGEMLRGVPAHARAPSLVKLMLWSLKLESLKWLQKQQNLNPSQVRTGLTGDSLVTQGKCDYFQE